MDGTATTHTDATAVLGPGQAEDIAQGPQQRHLRVEAEGVCLVIDSDGDRSHSFASQKLIDN